ncbi:hypothetical protein [Alkalibacterium thalassium]|nr:hypothetical protein [Alkalibacterium thalassium]
MSVQTMDTLVIIGAFLLTVGIPSFIIYKFKGGWMINLIVSSLLFIWMVPDFGFFRILLFLGFASFMLIINAVSYQGKSITSHDGKQLAENVSERRLTYEEIREQSKSMTDEERLKKQEKLIKELQEAENPQANTVACPSCSSIDVEHISNNKKSFSVGKAIGGGLLTGGIGTLAGFAGKKGKTDKWHCKNCGQVFNK